MTRRRADPAGSERLEQLRAQHATLQKLLDVLVLRLEEPTGPDGEPPARLEVLEAVAELGRLLPAHFALEERGGYLDEELARAPRLSRAADGLMKQHRELCQGIDDLSELTRPIADGSTRWHTLRARLEEFMALLRDHEALENRLTGDAYLDDLGGG